ncbi:MAG: TIM-barrel domain-containing protein [Planctomycetota bacterium]
MIEVRRQNRRFRIEAWGRDAVRIRVSPNPAWIDLPDALGDRPPAHEPGSHTDAAEDGGTARLVHGRVEATVDAAGAVAVRDTVSDRWLLRDDPRGHTFRPLGGDRYRLTARFEAFDGERLFGMGQHQHGRLDQKGCVLELRQVNAQVSVPVCVSNRGYVLLWNHSGTGQVSFGRNGTRWDADRTPQLDLWIAAGDTPADLMRRYAEATGFPTMMPDWALGFWQSKLRYRNQDELLDVARGFRDRGLPLSVMVIDYFHWTRMGDWRFDPDDWPDVPGMVAELRAMGVEPAVSVWPTVNLDSENAEALRDRGLLVRSVRGGDAVSAMADKPSERWQRLLLYDATNPGARAFMWDRIKQHYVDYGIRVFWLDACEPEVEPIEHDNLIFHAGAGDEVAGRYPLDHQRAFHDGLTSTGETEVVTLCRSAWAGSQRYGALVWSGDIETTWASLRKSVRAGLNMAMAGIPWWTTDIGGFHGGDPADPAYRRLIARWFQYAGFCPVFRLHGNRLPRTLFSGGPNEPWSYGDETQTIFHATMQRRERLRPYLARAMRHAHETGTPPMRPVWFDAPDDPHAWAVEDQYLLGPDVLVAPVCADGVASRPVYLPAGRDWLDPATGDTHPGGSRVECAAPPDRIPALVRADAEDRSALADILSD